MKIYDRQHALVQSWEGSWSKQSAPLLLHPETRIMNFVQQLEECYRDLAAEARKKHPGVKEASERAQLKLRSLQNSYVKQVRQANQLNSTPSSPGVPSCPAPTTAIFASSELLHPFLIAANYPNASATPLLDISLSAMKLLLANEAVLPSDGIHMVRVWMIQAQVIASHYEKQYGLAQEMLPAESSSSSSSSSAASSAPPTAGTSSSWFSWGSSSTSNAATLAASPASGNKGGGASEAAVSHPHASAVKNAVSSSSGGAGGGTTSHQLHNLDRVASEILSCLLQLLQFLLKDIDADGSTREETASSLAPPLDFWTNALALCVLWLPVLPVKHTVHQAARSTLSQVVSGMYSLVDATSVRTLHGPTWEDLLHLVSRKGGAATPKFHGALGMLKAPNKLPSRAVGLELLGQILTQTRKNENAFINGDDKLVTRTLGVCMGLLRESTKVPVDLWLRIAQFTSQLFLALQATYPNECTELLSALLSPITSATETCRQSDDFEDGFVYTNLHTAATTIGTGSSTVAAPSLPPASYHCLLPANSLWKAGITLEAVATILERVVSENAGLLFDPTAESSRLSSGATLILALTEALSDFCTILASCQLHILQLVEFARALSENTTAQGMFLDGASLLSSYYYYKPSLMRRAEAAIASANTSIFDETSTTINSGVASAQSGRKTGKGDTSGVSNASNSGTGVISSSLLGETLFIAMQSILRVVDCIGLSQGAPGQKSSRAAIVPALLEETFAPTLSVLQHYLKRFVGSRDLVQFALRGYASLANICIPLKEEAALQRKALLTSLCKLSIPNWGMHHDPPSSMTLTQLQDHHIRALLFLFRIVHTHHDSIHQEWEIILWTCEELAEMPIASPSLSDEAYHAALAVSAVLCRFAAFTTCFSSDSLLQMAGALTDIARSAMSNRDIVGDTETVLPQRTLGASATESGDDRETFSGKIVSMGVRAIYGGHGGSVDENGEHNQPAERTRNSFYEDYRHDFINRLSSSSTKVRVGSIGKLPFSLALLTDVVMANSFRWQRCGDEFSDLLSRLANSCPVVRPYTMDVISMLTMSNVSNERSLPVPFIGPGQVVFTDPMQSQLWAVEKIREDSENRELRDQTNKSQSQVLTPICHTIRTSQKAEIAESSLGALVSVLEGVGHTIDGEAWTVAIEAVASLSGDPLYEVDRTSVEWSSCCLAAFRSLKFIVDDFLHQFIASDTSSSPTLHALLDCCSAFGRSHHDVNTSLTALGLLWTIADQDSGSESIDMALSKLVLLSVDNRQEVRNAAVNTLFSCLIGKGGAFSDERWESCFSDCICKIYYQVMSGGSSEDAAPSFQSSKTSRYNVARHHSRDSIGKQWVTTQVLVLRGLMRVLRQFFAKLLDTSNQIAQGDVPWFQDAWVKILDFAFDAASQQGDKDTMELQSIGVELLVACCQLASEAGIQAASTPARVGTNMEVVNGALRSVRETQLNEGSYQRSLSKVSETLRQNLFLEAFEGLESYKEVIEQLQGSNSIDDKLLQILHKFGVGLLHIFECCKGKELGRNQLEFDLKAFESPPTEEADYHALDARFVCIVTTTLRVASIGSKSRFLNQAQRSCLALLHTMASEGSAEACKQLASLADSSFFSFNYVSDAVCEENVAIDASSLVGKEAATIVSNLSSKNDVREVCKALMLHDLLLSFVKRHESESMASENVGLYYKPLIPIISSGLLAVSSLNANAHAAALVQHAWTNFLSALSKMLTPVLTDAGAMVIPCPTDVIEVIGAAQANLVDGYSRDLCKVLSLGTKTAFHVACEQDDAVGKKDDDAENMSKALLYRDSHIHLFKKCFGAVCSINPDEDLLRSIANQAIQNALSTGDDFDSVRFSHQGALIVCEAVLQSEGNMERLVMAVFPLLCKLVLSPHTSLREAACSVFAAVNVAEIVQSAHLRCEEAEQRAARAESKVEELVNRANTLQKENEKLKKDVAVLEASAVQ